MTHGGPAVLDASVGAGNAAAKTRKRVWVQNVAVNAEVLETQLDAITRRLCPEPGTEQAAMLSGAARLIGRAREAAYRENPIPTRWQMWWRGTLIEAAYQNLHAAEALLVRLYDDAEVDAEMTEAVSRVEAGLAQNDRRRQLAGRALTLPAGEGKRLQLSKLVEVGYAASDRLHSRLRSFRNATLLTALTLAIFVGGFVAVVAWHPSAVPLCFHPSPSGPTYCPTGTGTPGTGDVLIVAGLGLLGGTLAGAVAIRNLRGTSTPYDLPIALAVLKVPFGVLAAIGGLIALRGGFVPGLSALDSQEQILAYCLLFGYAQQLVTGQIDKQAQRLLQQVPSKDSNTERPEVLPALPAEASGTGAVVAEAGPPPLAAPVTTARAT